MRSYPLTSGARSVIARTEGPQNQEVERALQEFDAGGSWTHRCVGTLLHNP